MRIALVKGERVLATPGLHGICPSCGGKVLARCGNIRVHHWAHESGTDCPWSKRETGETEWHVAWKNRFPLDWQEIRHVNEHNGEIHIADVETPAHLVLEFQHSPIDPLERLSRELFYRNMFWIVDGTRQPKFYEKFHDYLETINLDFANPKLTVFDNAEELLPQEWTHSIVPVFFDFMGLEQEPSPASQQTLLFCYWHVSYKIPDVRIAHRLRSAGVKIPKDDIEHYSLLYIIPREMFIAAAQQGRINVNSMWDSFTNYFYGTRVEQSRRLYRTTWRGLS